MRAPQMSASGDHHVTVMTTSPSAWPVYRDLAGMNLVGELAVGLRKASRLEIIDLSQNT